MDTSEMPSTPDRPAVDEAEQKSPDASVVSNKAAPVAPGTPRPQTSSSTRYRVKVYKLAETVWDELGIGDLECMEADSELELSVKCESSGAELLKASTAIGIRYSRQQDTLIVWSDVNDNDHSLSFQEKDGCDATWSLICKAKGVPDTVEEIDLSTVGFTDQGSEDDEARLDPELSASSIVTKIELPVPDVSNLEKWQEVFDDLSTRKQEAMMKGDRELRDVVSSQSDYIAEQIVDKEKNYLIQLVDTFEICEDLEDTQSLERCCSIMAGMFCMCNNALFEALFADDVLLHAIGMMEYDPARKERINHREFLVEKAKFKEVVELGDPEIVSMIHQSYRIQYIKDVIFSGVFDDSLQSTLQSYIYYANVEVCEKLSQDSRFLQALFDGLRDSSVEDQVYCDRINVLKDLCTLSKNLKAEDKPKLYKTLVDHGLFDLYGIFMSQPRTDVKRAALGILLIYQQQDHTLVRDSIIRPTSLKPRPSVLQACADAFVNEKSTVLLPQLITAIKYIVDVDNFEPRTPADKTKLLQVFYDEVLSTLLQPLSWDASIDTDIVRHEKINHALCLLAHLIPTHTYHIKNYVFRHSVLQTAMKHVVSGKSVLVLSALRLLRVVVGLKNEFYSRHLMKFGLFGSVVELVLQNGPKYNLLNSCILELLKFIEHENIKSLVSHFAEVHGDALRKLTYVSTAQDLLTRHLKNTEVVTDETSSATTSTDGDHRKRRDTTMDLEEEDYWDDDDMEPQSKSSLDAKDTSTTIAATDSDTTGGGTTSEPDRPFVPFRKRLVSYDSDDDDEEDAIFALAKKQQKTTTK